MYSDIHVRIPAQTRNVVTLERRIEKAYEAINKLGEVQRVFISQRYLDLKRAETAEAEEYRKVCAARAEVGDEVVATSVPDSASTTSPSPRSAPH